MPYELPNMSSTGGIEEVFKYGTSQVPILAPAILFLIYIVILAGGYFSQERRTGAGNFLMWASISGLITTTAGFMLFLYDNIVSLQVIIVLMVITIISAFAFLVTPRE